MKTTRIFTSGNVDDGKSTLIGRLLHDSGLILKDQLASLRRASEAQGKSELNLALITDGLKEERALGITIDVAYRYFYTPKSKIILIDTPGHLQYLRNMVTGASNADVALLLVDASRGVTEQTKRHFFVSSLLGISQLIVCINKMDLVEYSETAHDRIRGEFEDLLSRPAFQIEARKGVPAALRFIPMSALNGDNVVHASDKMPWHPGAPLLRTLEELPAGSAPTASRNGLGTALRLPIQQVQASGRLAGPLFNGVVRKDDDILILPQGISSKIKAVFVHGQEVSQASAPMNVSVELESPATATRGNMIVHAQCPPELRPRAGRNHEATLCWMDAAALTPGARHILIHACRHVKATVGELIHRINISSLTLDPFVPASPQALGQNEIGRVRLTTDEPLVTDSYGQHRDMGSFILVDDRTCATVAAGMLIHRG